MTQVLTVTTTHKFPPQDDYGVGGLNFFCSDGSATDTPSKLIAPNSEVKFNGRDVWSGFSSCPTGRVICGVDTVGEWEMADDVAVSKVRFYCCEYTAPSGMEIYES